MRTSQPSSRFSTSTSMGQSPWRNGSTVRVLLFNELALPGEARGPIIQMSALLLAIVGALWLVVCHNVANLFLARSSKRRGRRNRGACEAYARSTAKLLAARGVECFLLYDPTTQADADFLGTFEGAYPAVEVTP